MSAPHRPLECRTPLGKYDFHRDQIDLLIRILRWWWRDRNDVYISGNLTVYYNQEQLKTRDFRGPDFFVVLGTKKKDRKSWVVWGEQGASLPPREN